MTREIALIDPGQVLQLILLGAVLGVIGQAARSLGEVADPESKINGRGLAVLTLTSALIGATAGALGAMTFIGKDLHKQDLFVLLGAGYAGTDFISQFLKRQFKSLRRDPGAD